MKVRKKEKEKHAHTNYYNQSTFYNLLLIKEKNKAISLARFIALPEYRKICYYWTYATM